MVDVNKKSMLSKMNMPVGKDLKEKFNTWLNDNINIPASEAGHEDIGAGLSAALSAAGELAIPEDLADVALSFIPGVKVARAGKKGMKVLKPLEKAIDYGAIKEAEQLAAKAAREASEKGANTLVYGKSGNVSMKKPEL